MKALVKAKIKFYYDVNNVVSVWDLKDTGNTTHTLACSFKMCVLNFIIQYKALKRNNLNIAYCKNSYVLLVQSSVFIDITSILVQTCSTSWPLTQVKSVPQSHRGVFFLSY